MSDEWYIESGGRTEGPLSEPEVHARAAGGRLGPGDRVSRDGRRTWTPAREVPGLPLAPAPGRVAAPPRPLVETVVSASPPDLTDSTPHGPPADPLGSVPGYELKGLLGTGACGVVFRAVQTKLGREVALKTVLLADNTPPDVLARFDLEAVALARLQHPNIVAVYDCGQVQGRAFFAMELLSGEDLGQKLGRDGPLTERAAWLIARQTAAALDHAARNGVIHRDVKPANLFLVPPPTGFPLPSGVPMVKVTDFGLALTRRGPDESGPGTPDEAGKFLGTPIYMPPEQFHGPVDHRADVYSLGATVFHVLTGRLPFDGRTVTEVLHQKDGPPPRLTAPVSPESADLVADMMAADPNRRPATYAEVIARIDALPCLDGAFTTAGLPIVDPTTRPAPAPPPRRPRFRAALLVAGLLVAVAAAGFVLTRGEREPDPPPFADVGTTRPLFDGRGLIGWTGSGWAVERDPVEDEPLLVGSGRAVRVLFPMDHFRVSVRIDLYEAQAVEVVAAVGDGPGAAPQWVVRVDRAGGAVFGRRDTPEAELKALRPAVALPAADGLKLPFLKVRYERAGGVLSAWLGDQPLGRARDRGLKTDVLTLDAIGGAVRIQAAEQIEVAETGPR